MRWMGLLFFVCVCSPAWADPTPQCDPTRGQFINILECRDYAGDLSNCDWDSTVECWVYHAPRPNTGTGCDPTLHQFDDPWTCQAYAQGEACTFNIFTRCFSPEPVGSRCSSQASRYLTRDECERVSGRSCYVDAGCYSPVPLPYQPAR